MASYYLLDTGPLGLACKKPGDPRAEACRRWISGLIKAGHLIIVPEIAAYELRRELLRIEATDWLDRLDALVPRLSYLPITTEAMRRAAEFWAIVRRAGMPTALPEALDGDAILAAQAVTAAQPGDMVIVVTTNVGHLERFPGVLVQPLDYVQP